jgi:excisionase family DNA binding protein
MTSKWLTIGQIADYLQVSREKIYRLCQKGKMPASKVGGQWRFDAQEVDEWVRKQRPACENKMIPKLSVK